ncbi:MAG TPA: glycosyltransferase [Actinomycetes bacterium]|nr:glycosyltransferase [Actinomycetes bacterium]
MTLPLLGLALQRRPPSSLVPLLAAMYRWCVPATLDPAAGRPAAVLATAASVGRVPAELPLALWTRSAGEVASAVGGRAAAIVSDEQPVVDAAGDRGVLAASGSHARGRRPMSPFVRERLRRARGLPEVAVLEQTDDGWRWPGLPGPLEDELVATAMACASAVVVREPARLLEALAWGAPCVSERGPARQVGAVPQTHVLVSSAAPKRLQLAARLSADPELASRLSWAGRRLVERRHDAAWAAMRLAELLALRPTLPQGALASARLQLSLLGTADDASIASRFTEATARVAGDRPR